MLALFEHADTHALELSTLDMVDMHAGAANGVANGSDYDAGRVEYDVASALINYEEYHPFGTSAYRAVDSTIQVSAKRYRYAAAERDEETGLDHMGLRYYAPWLGRWTSADPIGLGDGVNRYAYVHGNPVSMRDPGGTSTQTSLLQELGERQAALQGDIARASFEGHDVTALMEELETVTGEFTAEARQLGVAALESEVKAAFDLSEAVREDAEARASVLTPEAEAHTAERVARAERFVRESYAVSTLGGGVGWAVASSVTDDPERITSAAEFGANVSGFVAPRGRGGQGRAPSRGPGPRTAPVTPTQTAASRTVQRQRSRTGWTPGPHDVDWRGTDKGLQEALKEAFRQTGVAREGFEITRWGSDVHGKSFPVEWRSPGGAEVNIDLGHARHGPDAPHVGFQSPGKRGSGGAVRGHILLDDVPYNR